MNNAQQRELGWYWVNTFVNNRFPQQMWVPLLWHCEEADAEDDSLNEYLWLDSSHNEFDGKILGVEATRLPGPLPEVEKSVREAFESVELNTTKISVVPKTKKAIFTLSIVNDDFKDLELMKFAQIQQAMTQIVHPKARLLSFGDNHMIFEEAEPLDWRGHIIDGVEDDDLDDFDPEDWEKDEDDIEDDDTEDLSDDELEEVVRHRLNEMPLESLLLGMPRHDLLRLNTIVSQDTKKRK